MRRIFISLSSILICASALAGEADVAGVKVTAETGGTFTFEVTVLHADAGWAHYADKWEIMGTDGTVYGTRVLAHPHDDEQPFTRSQSGIVIPEGVKVVNVRAHDLVHEFGGKQMAAALPGR
jgi:hypothetical protein